MVILCIMLAATLFAGIRLISYFRKTGRKLGMLLAGIICVAGVLFCVYYMAVLLLVKGIS